MFFYFHAQVLPVVLEAFWGDNIRIHWHAKSLSFLFSFFRPCAILATFTLRPIHHNCVFLVFHVSFINFELSSTDWNKRLLLQLFQYSYCSQCHMCYALCTYIFLSVSHFFFSNFFFILLLCVSLATDQTNIKISIEQTNSVNLIFFSQRAEKTFETNILNVQFFSFVCWQNQWKMVTYLVNICSFNT